MGSLQVEGGLALRPRTRAVLAALAVRRGAVVAPDALAQAIWGEQLPQSWPKQVQICIWDLRRAVGADGVQTVDGGYRLTLGDHSDVDLFESLATRGRELVELGEPDRAVSTFRSALDLWRGDPFQDVDGWPPGRIEAARLEELWRKVQEDLIEARLAAGDHREVVSDAEALVSQEPLRERRWGLLALARYRSGNQAEALRTLRQARRTFVEELGLDPGRELVDLEAAILDHDPSLLGAVSGTVSRQCPYKGLAPYDITDAETFFGRSDEIAECLERLASVRMLVLAGPSGCGKSSFVRAGLVPALGRAGRTVVVVMPGSDPDAALTAALGASSGDPMVVVDQLEEVFAGRPAAEARAFCARLAAYATLRGQVICTIRSDHLGDLAGEPTLARLVEDGLHLVSPLQGSELRATIEGPAAAAGLLLEPGLIELLVHEADGEPGVLPLLSHALAETWERRDGRVLTVAGYLATGEIHGSVARSAEQLYLSLPADQQQRLRALLLRLVVPSPDGAPIRVHLDASRLQFGVDRERLVEVMLRARLLTADDATVQLAHEALTTAWPRLRAWVEEDATGLLVLQNLSHASDEWERLGRPDSDLYRGARLAAAQEWQANATQELTATETEFLDASSASQEQARIVLIEETRRQRRQNRVLRSALAAVLVLLLIASGAGAVALSQRRQAEAQRRDAAVTALASEAVSLRTSRRDLAALLAVQAHRLRPDARSEAALFGTFTASPGVERIVHTETKLGLTSTDAEFLRDGQTVAIGTADGGVQLRNLATGAMSALPALSSTPGWPVFDVAADGRYLAAAWRPSYQPETGIVTVWDLKTHRQRFTPVTVDFRIGDVAVAPDGSTVAVSGGEQGRTLILDGATGSPRYDLPTLGRPHDAANVVVTAAIAFTTTGQLVVGSLAGPIRTVDPKSGAEVRRIHATPQSSNGFVGVSADGRSVLAAGNSATNRYDLETGQPLWPHPIAGDRCNTHTVVERLGIILCGQWTGRVTAFDFATGTPLGARYDAQQGPVCALAANPGGDLLVEVSGCVSNDVTLVEWRLDGGGPISKLVADTPTQPGIDLLGQAEALIEYGKTQDEPYTTYQLDLATQRQQALPGIFGFLPTSDPDIAVVVFDDGNTAPTIGRYDLSQREAIGPAINPLIVPDGGVWTNGRLVVVRDGTDDQKIRTFDLVTGLAVGWTEDTPAQQNATDMVLIGDTAYVAWLLSENLDTYTVQRRDVRTGKVLATSPPGYQTVAANGGRVIAATVDGRLAELDTQTLQPIGAPFPGTNGPVDSLAIDNDGHRLLLGADRNLRLYDIPTRTVLGDPLDTNTDFASIKLRGDGKLAAVAANDGLIVWDLDPAHWDNAACQLAGRNLTHEEWKRYLGTIAPYSTTCPQYPSGLDP